MTTTLSTDTGISLSTNIHCVAELLDHAGPHIVLDTMAKQVMMPKNKKKTIQFRRIVTFSAATTPLTEGVAPRATQFSYETVNATLKQFGEYVEITDHIEDTAEDPVLRDATTALGENLGRTREALLYAVVKGGMSVSYANGTGRGDVNTAISANGLRNLARSLRANKAKPITRVLSSSQNYETKNVEASYVIFCHTDCMSDIRNLPGFIQTADYGKRDLVSDHEFGSWEDFRFVASADLTPIADVGAAKGSMVSTTGTSADVYPMIAVGQDAYAAVTLKGTKTSGQNSVSLIINPVGKAGSSDPLAQKGTVGWKTWFAALILNESWMERYEVAVTDLAAA